MRSRALGPRFRPVVGARRQLLACASRSAFPGRRARRVDLFHAPHYVVPPLSPGRIVVTIHDCIHLRFPQYCRIAARSPTRETMMRSAARRVAPRADGVAGLEGRHPALPEGAPADKVEVIYNALDERLAATPTAEAIGHVRERFQLDLAVHALYGEHQAAQERGPADRGVLDPPARRARGRQAPHHRRRDLQVPEPAPPRAPASAAPARAVPRVRARRDAGGAVPAGVGVRVPVAVRRVRAAAARGDGGRRARSSRPTCRRCPRSSATPPCWSIRWMPARSPTPWPACSATRRLRDELVRRGLERVKAFSWERSVARVRQVYGETRQDAARVADGDRTGAAAPGPACRVALVHDWLTGMRGGEKVLESLCRLFPDADLLTLVHQRGIGLARIEAAARFARRWCSELPRAARCYRALPAGLPVRHRAIRPRRRGSGDLDEPLRGQVGRADRARAAPLLLPFADALRVGSVRRLLRPGPASARSRTRPRGPCWRGWRDGTGATAHRVDRYVANSTLRCRADCAVL